MDKDEGARDEEDMDKDERARDEYDMDKDEKDMDKDEGAKDEDDMVMMGKDEAVNEQDDMEEDGRDKELNTPKFYARQRFSHLYDLYRMKKNYELLRTVQKRWKITRSCKEKST